MNGWMIIIAVVAHVHSYRTHIAHNRTKHTDEYVVRIRKQN